MRKPLLSMYQDLKESGSTSDFPNILANVMYKVLLQKFKGVASPWKLYTTQSDLSDFKTADRDLMDEAPDLVEVQENGEYKDSSIKDYKYQIQLGTFGRTFSIGRRAIINDDLQALKTIPEKFGRAAARTLIKQIVRMIEGDGLMYDGKSMFAANRTVLNYASTTLTNDAAGIAAVAAGMTAIGKQTDETGEKMGITAKYLVVPPDLEDTAMRIVNGTAFIPVSTSGGTNELGMVKRLQVLVEPFLTSTTGWYVMADPADAPVVEVGFLNGKQTPDLLVLAPTAMNLAGGDDQWGFDFDELNYKVRHDWATQRAYYQGIYRGKA